MSIPPNEVNIEEVAKDANIRASDAKTTYLYEDPEVRTHRLQQAALDAQQRRVKEAVLFGVAILGAIGPCRYLCVLHPDHVTRRQALGILNTHTNFHVHGIYRLSYGKQSLFWLVICERMTPSVRLQLALVLLKFYVYYT